MERSLHFGPNEVVETVNDKYFIVRSGEVPDKLAKRVGVILERCNNYERMKPIVEKIPGNCLIYVVHNKGDEKETFQYYVALSGFGKIGQVKFTETFEKLRTEFRKEEDGFDLIPFTFVGTRHAYILAQNNSLPSMSKVPIVEVETLNWVYIFSRYIQRIADRDLDYWRNSEGGLEHNVEEAFLIAEFQKSVKSLKDACKLEMEDLFLYFSLPILSEKEQILLAMYYHEINGKGKKEIKRTALRTEACFPKVEEEIINILKSPLPIKIEWELTEEEEGVDIRFGRKEVKVKFKLSDKLELDFSFLQESHNLQKLKELVSKRDSIFEKIKEKNQIAESEELKKVFEYFLKRLKSTNVISVGMGLTHCSEDNLMNFLFNDFQIPKLSGQHYLFNISLFRNKKKLSMQIRDMCSHCISVFPKQFEVLVDHGNPMDGNNRRRLLFYLMALLVDDFGEKIREAINKQKSCCSLFCSCLTVSKTKRILKELLDIELHIYEGWIEGKDRVLFCFLLSLTRAGYNDAFMEAWELFKPDSIAKQVEFLGSKMAHPQKKYSLYPNPEWDSPDFKALQTMETFNLADRTVPYETTLLHIAVTYKNDEVFDFLLEQGVNANTENSEKHVPLYYALLFGNENFVCRLVESMSIEVLHTPLFFTALAMSNNVKAVKAFLSSPEIETALGPKIAEALHFATVAANLDVFELLLEKITEIDMKGKEVFKSLLFAAKCRHEHLFNYLLESRWELLKENVEYFTYKEEETGYTLFHYAALYGYSKIFQIFRITSQEDRIFFGRIKNHIFSLGKNNETIIHFAILHYEWQEKEREKHLRENEVVEIEPIIYNVFEMLKNMEKKSVEDS